MALWQLKKNCNVFCTVSVITILRENKYVLGQRNNETWFYRGSQLTVCCLNLSIHGQLIKMTAYDWTLDRYWISCF